MTAALYHTDAYLREFDASITSVDGNKVALDRTAFYPGGGGQPHDVGTLTANGETLNVVKVRGLASVSVYAWLSELCVVLNREAAENMGRPDKALSPTFFNA